MAWKVQLPDYPVHHIVTGFTTGRGASGRNLLLAEALACRPGLKPHRCCDIISLMLLHDAIRARQVGDYRTNDIRLYGRAKSNQALSAARIAGAVVEELPADRDVV